MNEVRLPLTVWLEVTRKCNLKCKHCMITDEYKFMSLEDAKKIIDMLHEAKVFKLYISGGEPLLWEPLPELVSYSSEKGVWPLIQTNGTLLTDSIAEKLAENKVGALDITIYGINETTHNYVTGSSDSLQKVRSALDICRKYGIRVFLSFMVLSHNLQELPKVFEWTLDKGLDLLHVRRYIAKSLSDPLRPRNPEFKETLIESFETLKSINANGEKIHVEFEEGFPLHHGLGDNICAAAYQLCLIDVEGRISPCPYIRIFGEDILEEGFEYVWASSKVLNELRSIKGFEGPCEMCTFKSSCKGGCRAAAYCAYSSLKASDPDCWIGEMRS